MPDLTPDTPVEDVTADTAEAEGATPDAALDDPGKKALDAERKARREADRKAKQLEAELAEFRKASMSEQERMVAEARDAGRTEAMAELAGERVADIVRAAAAGRSTDVDALLDGLDRSRFVIDGQPDRDAIHAWIDRVAPAAGQPTTPTVDLGQGVRSTMPLNGDGIEQALKAALGI